MKKREIEYLPYIVGLIVIILWFLSWVLIDHNFSDNSKKGTFGDQFGAINALFSGLAFAGIIISLNYQKKEMKLQRDEMKETREEFIQQNFQTAFFNLLKTQQEILDGISIRMNVLQGYNRESGWLVEKRYFFVQSREELYKIYCNLEHGYSKTYNVLDNLKDIREPSDEEEARILSKECKSKYTNYIYKIDNRIITKYKKLSIEDKMKIIYWKFFERYGFVFGHYFRHIYHILKYIEKVEDAKLAKSQNAEVNSEIKKEILHYVDMLQAQMSAPELLLLFYNSMIFPKLHLLLVKYDILGNLNSSSLLDSSHNCINGIKLKENKDILDIESMFSK